MGRFAELKTYIQRHFGEYVRVEEFVN